MSLTYNPATKALLSQLQANLPQGVLLEGLVGVGLFTAAQQLASGDVAGIIRPTDADGNEDMTAKGIIRLPQIHELQQLARGKSTRTQVFIIDNADQMNHQAQNALLKLLEEPNESVRFILTSHQPDALLDTILSRVQRVTVAPLSRDDSAHFIRTNGVKDERKTTQLLFIASGRPAELARLIADDARFTKAAETAGDARTLIGGTAADKMRVVMKYQSDKSAALQLLDATRAMVLFSLQRSPSDELISFIDRLALAYDRIAANGNVRLQLVNVVI